MQKWNTELQPELRFSPTTAFSVALKTDGFSFAYLKELFVSSMTQWMALEGNTQMDEIVMEQLSWLRGQMSDSKETQASK